MKCYQILFSPTGGTEKVARAITRSWPEVRTIDLSVPDADYAGIVLEPDALVLVAMPSFGGLAPQTALERLAKIRGCGAKCALAAVYGNRAYEDTLVQMEDCAAAAGFQVIAAVSAVAEHSIVREYGAGRPDAEDCGELTGFGEKILQKARSGAVSGPHLPGNRPYKKASGGGMLPKAGAACTGCGQCAQKCPVGAILPENPREADKDRCISCMRCVAVCPAHARTLNPLMLAAVRTALRKPCAGRKPNELFLP